MQCRVGVVDILPDCIGNIAGAEDHWDGPRSAWENTATVGEIVARCAANAPYSAAVIDGLETASYRLLLDSAASISMLLRLRGARNGTRIGVAANPSANLFATILAIWSLGAVYVPLDPSQPAARFAFIIEDAGVELIAVQRAFAGDLTFPHLIVDERLPKNDRALAMEARLADTACIVYTSGSTGTPKGVEIVHAGLANAMLASNEICGFNATDRQLYRTSIGFDVSLYEMFGPLVVGAAVIVAPRETWADPRATIALIERHAVTAISLSTSFLALVIEEDTFAACTSLRIVTSGTETMSAGLCVRFFAVSRAALYNGYGPSEATIVVTVHRCSPLDAMTGEESAPLGRALPNTHVSVRDENLRLVGPGASGEIVIGGVQLARGYVNRPDETAARFVDDPLQPGRRIYRSGDIARVLADGSIVFLGRNDRQVKIRGHRVEPAEVAAAIERIDGVRTAVVLARPRNGDGQLILAAFIAPRAGAKLHVAALRRELRGLVPDAMVPAEMLLLDAFPLTISGKIDEAALALRETHAIARDSVLPLRPADVLRGILHEQLRVIWEDLFRIDGVSDYESFYDLGGDSLLALRLTLRLEETFGRRIASAELYQDMTIAGLADVLLREEASDGREPAVLNANGTLPPLAFLHGDFAGGMYAWTLAKLLGSDQPMLVIPPHGAPGMPAPCEVVTMASDVATLVERSFPAGPVRICGYSAAGLVAYEAARQLVSAGRIVLQTSVIGISARNVAFTNVDRTARALRLPRHAWDRILRLAMEVTFRIERLGRMDAAQRFTQLARLMRRSVNRPVATNILEDIELSEGYRRYLEAHETYIPGRYDGELLVVWPAEQPVENGDVRRDWSCVAPQAAFAEVRGSHHEAVSRYLPELAAALRAGRPVPAREG